MVSGCLWPPKFEVMLRRHELSGVQVSRESGGRGECNDGGLKVCATCLSYIVRSWLPPCSADRMEPFFTRNLFHQRPCERIAPQQFHRADIHLHTRDAAEIHSVPLGCDTLRVEGFARGRSHLFFL